MRYLFVGGIVDGRWIDTGGKERTRVTAAPVVRDTALRVDEVPSIAEVTLQQAYQAHKFRGSMPDTYWLVYAPLDWKVDQVFAKLLERYTP